MVTKVIMEAQAVMLGDCAMCSPRMEASEARAVHGVLRAITTPATAGTLVLLAQAVQATQVATVKPLGMVRIVEVPVEAAVAAEPDTAAQAVLEGVALLQEEATLMVSQATVAYGEPVAVALPLQRAGEWTENKAETALPV